MPVLDHYHSLPQSLEKRGWDDAEFVVVVTRAVGYEDREAVSDSESRGDDEHMLRVSVVLAARRFVQNLPSDRHRHNNCFASSGRELRTPTAEHSAVGGNVYPLAIR